MLRLSFLGMLFLSALANGQPRSVLPKYLIACGEYQCFMIPAATGKLYGISSNLRLLATGDNDVTPGLPALVALPSQLTIKAAASGLHNSGAVDNNGDVWTWGSNESAQMGNGTAENAKDNFPHKIARDSLGNPFTHVTDLTCWANAAAEGCLAIKSDGTVWIWGKTGGGFRANGQYGSLNKEPVQIYIPANRKIVKIVAGEIVLALASDGSVWTWGGANRAILLGTIGADFRRPTRVVLPQPAKDIAGGTYGSYVLGVNGKLYGWGYAGAFLGIGTGGYAANTPVSLPRDLTEDLKLPHPVMAIVTNSVSTHVILTDSTLWGWGDNATGAIGNGEELNFAAYIPPYSWDYGPGQLMVQKPVRVAPEIHNFVRVFGGSAYVFYTYAVTATGGLYSWGRNKAAVLGNGVIGASPEIMSIYPNSWDVPAVTEIDPLALKNTVLSTSPYCILHTEGSPCNETRIEKNKSPVASVKTVEVTGSNRASSSTKTIRLDASASSDEDGKIVYYKWKKISGPAGCKILSPQSPVTTLTGLTSGIYVFSITVTDNGWASHSTEITVNTTGKTP